MTLTPWLELSENCRTTRTGGPPWVCAGRVFAEGMSWESVTERYAMLVDDHLDLVSRSQRDPGPEPSKAKWRSHRGKGTLHEQGLTGESTVRSPKRLRAPLLSVRPWRQNAMTVETP